MQNASDTSLCQDTRGHFAALNTAIALKETKSKSAIRPLMQFTPSFFVQEEGIFLEDLHWRYISLNCQVQTTFFALLLLLWFCSALNEPNLDTNDILKEFHHLFEICVYFTFVLTDISFLHYSICSSLQLFNWPFFTYLYAKNPLI